MYILFLNPKPPFGLLTMHTVQVTRTIPAPIERVWTAFDTFDGIADFHPLVERSPALGTVTQGVGAERACYFYSGGFIKERVVAARPAQHQRIEVYETGPFPLKKAVADLGFRPRGAATEVTFTMNFTPKYGPLGWLLAHAVMKRQFARTLDGVLKGLDDHLRTGHPIGPKGVLLETAGDGAPALS